MDEYRKEMLTVNIVWANIFALIIVIPILIVFGVPFYLLWSSTVDIVATIKNLVFSNYFILLGLFLIGIAAHELIHGITWAQFATKGFKSIKFGILKKMLTPYCHCKEPLQVNHYITGAITPTIILGVIPSIISIITGNAGLLLFGMFFTMAGAGDILIIKKIYKEKRNDLVLDHPSEAGCYIYRK